jgi:hypothetical protein
MENQEIQKADQPIVEAGRCQKDSFFVNFTDDDIECLFQYAFDMGYLLEPEPTKAENHLPGRFKVISKSNPAVYGWISKVNELVENERQESFIYGFYRNQKYFNKYPITFNINAHQMRGMMKRNSIKNPRQTSYFRTIFGILDLEPKVNAVDFIFSWLWSVTIKHV